MGNYLYFNAATTNLSCSQSVNGIQFHSFVRNQFAIFFFWLEAFVLLIVHDFRQEVFFHNLKQVSWFKGFDLKLLVVQGLFWKKGKKVVTTNK